MINNQKFWFVYFLFILFHLCGISSAEAQPCKGVLELASEYFDEANFDTSKYQAIIDTLTDCQPGIFAKRQHKIRAYEFLIAALEWKRKKASEDKDNIFALASNYSALAVYRPSKKDSIITLLTANPPGLFSPDSIKVKAYKLLIAAREWKKENPPEDREKDKKNIFELAANYSALAVYRPSKKDSINDIIIKLLTDYPPNSLAQQYKIPAYKYLIAARKWKYDNALKGREKDKENLFALASNYSALVVHIPSKKDSINGIIIKLLTDNRPDTTFAQRKHVIGAYELLINAYWLKNVNEDSTDVINDKNQLDCNIKKLEQILYPKHPLFPGALGTYVESVINSGNRRKWWVVGGTAVAAGVAAAFLLTGGGPQQLPGPPGAPGEKK